MSQQNPEAHPGAKHAETPAERAPRPLSPIFTPYALMEYLTDATQRSLLFWDTMRQRGNQFFEHRAQEAPPVLVYDYELLVDGRTLDRPVNYILYRILPGPEHQIDPQKRPYVIVDPRAGHGPGIGGSKEDSQIGVALRGGHPVYFVSFRPLPEPGQRLEDIGRAEGHFLEEVRRRHPDAPKPCVIGNCQAGWAVAMLASVAPDLTGPIVLNGAPLSYWSGVDGKSVMRYMGGLWGGAWPTSMLSDLGKDRFDGAYLVLNFAQLDPANSLWSKQYNLYAKIDSEAPRYLGFEKWWTGFFQLTTDEMEFIVNNLFVGNKLGSNQIVLNSGTTVSLKNIKAPIVVFCSDGDNITPPTQALNWLLDIYASDEEIVADDQVIVYTVHKDIGHLGIFVSGKVAKKEHSAIIGTLEFIDRLQPGLYEMLIEDPAESNVDDPRLEGNYRIRFVERSLKDIKGLDDTRADEQYFDTFAQVSELTTGWYKAAMQPIVRAMTTEQGAALRRELLFSRAQHYLLSDRNPLLAAVGPLAEQARTSRRPVSPDNPYLAMERELSKGIETWLDSFRDVRDRSLEIWFKTVYGPFGLGAIFPPRGAARVVPVETEAQRRFAQRAEQLVAMIDQGGFPVGLARVILLLSRSDRDIEPDTFLRADDIARRHPRLKGFSVDEFRALFKDQFLTLFLDEEQAVAALPKLLATPEERREAVELAQAIVLAGNRPNPAERQTLLRIADALGLPAGAIGAAVAVGPDESEVEALRMENERLRNQLASLSDGKGAAVEKKL
jgi:tellurite resistance protein